MRDRGLPSSIRVPLGTPRSRRLASTLRGILGRCGGLSCELLRSDADDGRRTLLCSGHQRTTHKTRENSDPYFPFR